VQGVDGASNFDLKVREDTTTIEQLQVRMYVRAYCILILYGF